MMEKLATKRCWQGNSQGRVTCGASTHRQPTFTIDKGKAEGRSHKAQLYDYRVQHLATVHWRSPAIGRMAQLTEPASGPFGIPFQEHHL